MKTEKHVREGVTVLEINGRLTLGSGETELRRCLQETLDEGAKKVVFNLRGVSTIDSTGVGELVRCYTSATNRGSVLKLSNLPPKVNDILLITQLITVFDVFDTEDEAVRSFSAEA
jgi:anti-anti-sigma factor